MDDQLHKFTSGPPKYTLPGHPNNTTVGQEEGGRMRQPTTSVAGRVKKK